MTKKLVFRMPKSKGVPSPKPRHVTPQTEVRDPRVFVYVVRPAVLTHSFLSQNVLPLGLPFVQCANEGFRVHAVSVFVNPNS